MDYAALSHSLLPHLDGLLTAWLPGGYREGKEYVALNPCRTDHTPGSFRINCITGRWGDFATGDHGRDIVSLYAYLNHIGQGEAAKALSSPSGAWHTGTAAPKPSKAPKALPGCLPICQQFWKESLPAENTPVAAYLESRGYSGKIPDSVRYHPGLLHTPSKTLWPVMLAAVMRWPEDSVIAIHRTFLSRDGSGKAPVMPNKMMLGSVAGGAVRFGAIGIRLAITEGIETALSVYLATGLPVWAALSASNMQALVLPPQDITPDIIIAADHDRAGLSAAYASAEKWQAQGRRVKIALPPEGQDFNDVLRAGDV